MKKVILASLIGISSVAMAGGDIEPVDTADVMIETSVKSGFYLGLGYGYTTHEHDIYSVDLGTNYHAFDENFNSLLLQAGYQFNPYIALEGRYWIGFDSNFIVNEKYAAESSINAWAIYVKPMYPVTDTFNIYALLGYGGAEHTGNDDLSIPKMIVGDSYDGFSWGAGVDYDLTDDLSLFVDYVNIYDDDKSWIHPKGGWEKVSDEKIDIWSVGVSYKF